MAHKGIHEGLGVTLPKTRMEVVCEILSQFGLDAEVQERFRAHKLDDLEVVKELTPEELCEIGIVALGDRKKIAKLIDALKNGWIPRPAVRPESRPDALASVVVRPPVATYAQVRFGPSDDMATTLLSTAHLHASPCTLVLALVETSDA